MTAIRWGAIDARAPIGLRDLVLAEFVAPDKAAAVVELERRISAGELPARAIVVSALQHELIQGDAAQLARKKEIRRQARIQRGHAHRHRT